MTLQLDHLVINSHFSLDQSATLFAELGFTLTPRGYHSLGSINHLIMFDDHYLELIGLPNQTEPLRPELLDNPPGIDGLVFASHDAAQTWQDMQDAGFALQPVQHFSRKVIAAHAEGEARFSTVRLAAGSFSAGRVYFCQHHTPEWVWRDEWVQSGGIRALTLVAEDVTAAQANYARLGKTSLLRAISKEVWQRDYGHLLTAPATRATWFAAIHLAVADRSHIAQAAARLALPLEQRANHLRVALPALNLVLEFSDA